MGEIIWVASVIQFELILFAAAGFVLGGIDDLSIDVLYLTELLSRAIQRKPVLSVATLSPSTSPGRLAVFIPAWKEAGVIGPMLDRCLREWASSDVHFFVGVYPNDAATIAKVRHYADLHPYVTLVVNRQEGPTTKSDCLNRLWFAMLAHESEHAIRFKGVVQHDAEDMVHPDEIRVYDTFLDDLDMVQIPVIPVLSSRSRWVARHYADEFADSHHRGLIVRQFIGAAVPSAGVGCAFRRDMLERIAAVKNNAPFGEGSLTEDYELGLGIGGLGGKTGLVRVKDNGGHWVATRALFPERLPDAVRQKARWVLGISWMGWDRMGWSGGWAERWMRMRDRRDPLAMLILTASYLSLALLAILPFSPRPLSWPQEHWLFATLLSAATFLLAWRLAVRACFVFRLYGTREALRSVPRTIVGNAIMIMAGLRAMRQYVNTHQGSGARWDKTEHRFPDEQEQRQA